MEQQRSKSLNWIFQIILGCLFVLSITVPLAWHRAQKHKDSVTLRGSGPAVRKPMQRAPASEPNGQHRVNQFDAADGDLQLDDGFGPSELFDADTQQDTNDAQADPSLAGPIFNRPSSPELGQTNTSTADVDLAIRQPRVATIAPIFADLVLSDIKPKDDGRWASFGIDLGGVPRERFRTTNLLDVAPEPPEETLWPAPIVLFDRLDHLQSHGLTAAWSQRVRVRVEQLVSSNAHENADVVLDDLHKALRELAAIRRQTSDLKLHYDIGITAYDLARRLDVWSAASQIARADENNESQQPIAEFAMRGDLPIVSPPVKTIAIADLLQQIERYEHTRLVSHGRDLSESIGELSSSPDPNRRELGVELYRHYRNANLRVAVANALLNRMVPKQQAVAGQVNEQIMGIPVWGRSRTFTQLYLRLIPDPERIHVAMEARGRIQSDTTASSGPARIFNRGRSDFVVRKPLVIDHDGLSVGATMANANSQTSLVGVQTEFDDVPLLGNVARRVARRQHDERRGRALRETDRRIASEARQRFDREIQPQIQKVVDHFDRDVMKPMARLGLEPQPIDLETTDLRVVTRLRVGNADQLGAHTARPRALAGSLMSMQLHETLLNNGLAQFDLDGREFNLHDLFIWIAERLGRPADKVPEEMSKKVIVRFAEHDAVRVRCDDGKLRFTLAFAKLERGKDRWTNLVVHANYETEVDGLKAALVRNDSIRLSGDRIRTRDQVALRGVFSKLLSKSHRIPLVPDKLVKDPRMADLAVTGTIVDDGWICVSIGVDPQQHQMNLAKTQQAKKKRLTWRR